MRLPKKDWEKLDELLGKIGFGGYYDLLEVVRIGLFQSCKDKFEDKEERKKYEYTIRHDKDLKFLLVLSNELILMRKKKVACRACSILSKALELGISKRGYWLITELFVDLHDGKDVCLVTK